jgi:hypothetical protein
VLAEAFELAERIVGNEREPAAGGLGRKQVLGRAPVVAAGQPVHFFDADEPRAVGGGGLCDRPAGGHHGVEKRQGHGGAHAAEERPARHLLSGDEVHNVSPIRSSLPGLGAWV